MIRAVRAIALVGTVMLSGTAQAEPKVTDFTLENGMRAVVIEDHRAPVVTHMVWYRVGSVDEPGGKTGIAHFLEHLMFKGTETLESGDFSRIIAENGGEDNAFTSSDYTAYFQRIAKDRLGLVMSMEADRMRNLVVDDGEWEAERKVVLEERNSRTDTDPGAKFREQYSAALWMNSGYGNPVIGWRHEIEALTKEDALAFYEHYYAPNNAILVVAGDVTPAEVERLAKQHYGPIEYVELPEKPSATEPPQLAERRLKMADPRVSQPRMVRVYTAPSYVTATGREAEALSLLQDILSNGQTRRMPKTLTIDTDLALYAGAYYFGTARYSGQFGFYAGPTQDTSLAELEGAIDWMIRDVIENGVTEDELARAKKAAIADAVYAQDSQASLARYFGSALTVGISIEDALNWRARMEAVTVEDIREAARLVFKPERSVTGWLVPEPDAPQLKRGNG